MLTQSTPEPLLVGGTNTYQLLGQHTHLHADSSHLRISFVWHSDYLDVENTVTETQHKAM